MTTAAPTAPVDTTATSAPDEPASARSGLATRRATRWIVLSVLVLQFLAVGMWQAKHDSLTVDEAVDLASGVTSLVRHDLRMNPEHGPLPKALAALPALVANPVVPDGDDYDRAAWFDYTDDFVSANRDAGRLDDVVFLSRVVPLLLGAGCGLLLHRLGSRLFGDLVGLAAAGLWLTTPVVVGLSHFAMIDVPFTFAVLLMCEALRRYLAQPTNRALVALGAASSAALLTRHLALALVGVLLVAMVAARWRADRRRAWSSAALVGLVAFAGVWIGVRAIAPLPPGGEARALHESIVDEASDHSLPGRLVGAAPLPLEWKAGFGYLTITSDERPAYLFGHAWEGSRVWFFPGSLLTKLPISSFALLLASPFAWRSLGRERRRLASLVVLAPAALTFAVVLLQPLNLGLRLVLPTVALLMLCAASSVLLVADRRRLLAGVMAIGAVVQLGSFWQAAPHSLAWTAPPFQPAYRWVSDSNVDFAQDAGRLSDWVDARTAEGERVWVAQALPRGGEAPSGANPLVGADPAQIRGWVAVGATALTVTQRDELSWLRAYCPVGDIGGSILLYRFDDPPDPARGPTMPDPPCSGSVSRR